MAKKKQLPSWTYKGKEVKELGENVYGFIYELTFESGIKYIGQKKTVKETTILKRVDGKKRNGHIAFVNKLVKLSPEELAERKPSDKRTKKTAVYEKTLVESSSWRTYVGSSKDVPKDDKVVSRDILFFSSTKRTLTYLETAVLFSKSAVVKSTYYNKNILGRFFDNSLDGLIKLPK